MIYLWEIPETTLNKDIGEYDRKSSPDRFLLREGRKLGSTEFESIPLVQFKISKKRALKFDSLANNTQIPLINEKIRLILKEAASNQVEFFPAKIICSDGELEGYSFLNVTAEIIGIDNEKTIWDKSRTGFHYLTYKDGCMGEKIIARDKEYKGNLLISESLKTLFDNEKITGLWPVRPEDFYRPLGVSA